MKILKKFRTEIDVLGRVQVPKAAYYGSHTARAIQNFKISGSNSPKELYYAIAIIKKACSSTNIKLSRLTKSQGQAIIKACDELLEGSYDNQLVIDNFQAGAGTAINMNINEVIANRATEILKGRLGQYIIHPNNHVNMGQSSNNVIPTALRMVVIQKLLSLINKSQKLQRETKKKSIDWKNIKKSGRTHLQDAVPITLGQEFSGYAACLQNAITRIQKTLSTMHHIGLGGNAVGTSINNPSKYKKILIKELSSLLKIKCKKANSFAITQSHTDFLFVSSALVDLATEINKICNDLRLLNSGPITGLSEIHLPTVEPGSSIMPGKINPSICECMNMICFQVFGNHEAITHACNAGQLELNIFIPLISKNLIESITILTNGVEMLHKLCIKEMSPNKKMLAWYYEHSIGIATALNPLIGYDLASSVAKEAVRTQSTVKDVVIKRRILPKKTADKIFRRNKF